MFAIKSNDKFIKVSNHFGYMDFSVTQTPRLYVNEAPAQSDLADLIQYMMGAIESQSNNRNRDNVKLQKKQKELESAERRLNDLQTKPYIEVYMKVLMLQRRISQLEQDIQLLEHDEKLRNGYVNRFDSVLFSKLRVVEI